MSRADHEPNDGTGDERVDSDAIESVETYETAEGLVFYDAYNPLAWAKTTYSVSLPNQV